MNNEIKEILDAWRNKKYILAYTFNYDSAREQNDILLDYITNLQQENDRLKQPQVFIDTQDMEERYGEELYKDYLKEQIDDYKSRINKAIEYIKGNTHTCNYVDIYNYALREQDLLNIIQNGGNDNEDK